MSASYVRGYYGVDYKVGDRLTVDGRPGTLVSFPQQYLGIRFDGERRTSRAHPTWRVERIGGDAGEVNELGVAFVCLLGLLLAPVIVAVFG